MFLTRFVTAKFLALFVPAFLLVFGLSLYSLTDRYISNAEDRLSARIGSQVGRVSGLMTRELAETSPRLASKLISTMLSDPAITCVDASISGTRFEAIAQPRNLGCQILEPEKTIITSVLDAPDMKLTVGFNDAEIDKLRRETMVLAANTTLTGLVAAIVMGIVAFRYSVGAPIARLLTAIKGSKKGHTQRAPVSSSDEIGELCSAFNSMQDRLDGEKQRTSETLDDLRNVYDSTPALLFTMDENGIIRSASEFWLLETGYTADAVIGYPLDELTCRASRLRLRSKVMNDLKTIGSVRDVPLCIMGMDGRQIDVLLSGVPDRRRSSTVDKLFVCVMNDVTPLRRAEERLRSIAVTDQLTGLPNRHAIKDYFESAGADGIAGSSGWAILFVDLDNFKTVNDTFGHAAGDEVLRVTARRICDVVGSEGFVARIGGDEFAVFLPDLESSQKAESITKYLLDVLDKPIDLASGTGRVGASVGITYCNDRSLVPSEALKLSDQAMYLAKSEGKNRYAVYEESRTAAIRYRSEQVQLIKNGIAEDWFEIYLQPIINLRTMRPYAVEALLRIKQGKIAIESIETLIRLAEESGQIEALGEWIFEESIREFTELRAEGSVGDISLTINLSPKQLTESFFRKIKQSMEQKPEMASRLIFEITETSAFSRFEAVCDLLQDLRELGIRIAIDDFGSGHSSLSYLSRLPLDIVKLDKSFVDNAMANSMPRSVSESTATLIRSITSLASDLGLELVVEGLETNEAVERFIALGAILGQGYVFSRPTGVSEIKDWFRLFSGAQSLVMQQESKRLHA